MRLPTKARSGRLHWRHAAPNLASTAFKRAALTIDGAAIAAGNAPANAAVSTSLRECPGRSRDDLAFATHPAQTIW